MGKTAKDAGPSTGASPSARAMREQDSGGDGLLSPSFRLLTVRGISIGAHWSWLLVFALVAWSLSSQLFPRTIPGLSDRSYLLMGVASAVIFFGSILLHELGHAFRAIKEGMKVGDITLWLFGGVARFEGMFPSAGAEFRIAIAGPVVSLVLSILFAVAAAAGQALDLPQQVIGVSEYLARINAIVLAFNMVPALPLDGGRVLRAWLWHHQQSFTAATLSAAKAGKAFAYVLMAIGFLGFFSNAFVGGIWFIFLGFFLLQAATAEAQFVVLRRAFRSFRVRDLMTENPVVASPDWSVADFLGRFINVKGHSNYPVSDDGRLLGLISLRLAGSVAPDERDQTLVRDVMLPEERVPVLAPDTSLMDALSALRAGPGRAVVLDQDRIVGILSVSDVAKALELEQARGLAPERAARAAGPAVWLVVTLIIALAASAFYRPPLAVLSPADAIDVSDDISIQGAPVDRINGRYLLLAVRVERPTALLAVYSMLHPERDLVPLSAVAPEGLADQEFVNRQRNLFRESQMFAAAAAARAVGLEVALQGTGARVLAVLPGSPAAGVLREGDVITSVNGTPVTLAPELANLIRRQPQGTRFELTLERGGREVQVEVNSSIIDRQRQGHPGIGVVIETRDFNVDLPFEITFEQREVGGPSAGLAYALAIADMLDRRDIADGRTVGASGTVQVNGDVGPVGGLDQKAAAAEAAGAELLLVPAEEVGAVGSTEVRLSGVDTLEEAIAILAPPSNN
ncbi:MAG: CBS domain-containing protein [Actinomycetota bacterium]|nr:CBS domain-containing protein [Actinomycetota bacterium]